MKRNLASLSKILKCLILTCVLTRYVQNSFQTLNLYTFEIVEAFRLGKSNSETQSLHPDFPN